MKSIEMNFKKIGAISIVLCIVCSPMLAEVTIQPTPKPADAPQKQDKAAGDAKEQGKTDKSTTIENTSSGRGLAIVGACFGAGMCAIGGGYAIARIGSKCIESIARQPEAAGTMFGPMIVSAAMVEGGMLFAIVVCLMAIIKL